MERLANLGPPISLVWFIWKCEGGFYLLRRRRALHVLALGRRLGVVALVWLLVGHVPY